MASGEVAFLKDQGKRCRVCWIKKDLVCSLRRSQYIRLGLLPDYCTEVTTDGTVDSQTHGMRPPPNGFDSSSLVFPTKKQTF